MRFDRRKGNSLILGLRYFEKLWEWHCFLHRRFHLSNFHYSPEVCILAHHMCDYGVAQLLVFSFYLQIKYLLLHDLSHSLAILTLDVIALN